MVRRSNYILPALAGVSLIGGILLGLRTEVSEPALCINEFVANSSAVSDDSTEGVEWIELYNGTEDAINLNGYGLSDDPDDPFMYTFSDSIIEPNGFLLVSTGQIAGALGDILPLNFRLNARGGCIVLTAPNGVVADYFEYQTCYNEIPYGRAYDGGNPALLNKATPGYSNSASMVSRYVTETVDRERPVFSCPGGFYEEPFYLTIEHPEGTTVFYTIDGTVPDLSSIPYTEPIYIEDISSRPNRYAEILTTYEMNTLYRFGTEPVTKGTVIRARICRDGYLSEYTTDATYFIGITPEVTTVSLITDPDNLFGYFNGIYTSGVIGRYAPVTKNNTTNPENYNLIGNYTLRGKAASRPVHVEFYSAESDFKSTGQSAELRINGGLSGAKQPNRSLRLYATSKYGDSNLFDVDFTYQDNRPVDMSQLVLRTKRNFITGALQDVLGSVPFLNDNLYVQLYEPAALYLNGEFWGVAALRERITPKGIAARFGLDKKNMALIKYNDRNIDLVSGDPQDLTDYTNLQYYPLSHDMTTEDAYQSIAEQVDLDSYIRQQWARIFFACCDWPDNNMRIFRSHQTDPDNPYSDGKWRYVLYDQDLTCMDYTHNTLLYAMGLLEDRADGWDYSQKLPEWSTILFQGLMDNPHFRQQFLEVYKEYRAEIFQPDYLNGLLDEILSAYGSELEHHVERWSASPILPMKLLGADPMVPDIYEDLNAMKAFFDNRLSYMDSFMEEFYAGKGETIQWN